MRKQPVNPSQAMALSEMSLDELAKAAKAGRPGALAELRKQIDARPERYNGYQGSLALLTEEVLLSHWEETKNGSVLVKETFRRKLQALKDELAGPNPSPMELLLIERIGICWLKCHTASARAALATNLPGEHHAAAWHGEQEAKFHKMLLASIKTLAQVRKLQLPNVQINVGEKQINVQG